MQTTGSTITVEKDTLLVINPLTLCTNNIISRGKFTQHIKY